MDTDYLKTSDGSGDAVLAHITADRNIGSTTIEVDSLDKWSDFFIVTTGNLLASGFIDPDTITQMLAHEDSGDIVIDAFEPGYTDQGNTDGQVAIIKQTSGWANRVADRLRKTAQEGFADFVASGLVATQDSGLDLDISAGVVWIDGYRIEIAAVSGQTLLASKDIYVDLGLDNTTDDGYSYDYNDVANGAASPALATDHVRIAKIITDGSGITSVVQKGTDSLGNAIYNTSIAGLVNEIIYTSSGTWRKKPGLKYIEVEQVGGGGGGGASTTTANTVGNGGGGGGYTRKRIMAADLNSTETATIGAAGAAGASTSGNGGNGGDTTFGAHATAGGGGGGGNGGGSIGAGGTATGGDLNIPGQSGSGGGLQGSTVARPGEGGNSKYGFGGKALGAPNQTGQAGSGYGGGGAGGLNTSASRAGGPGTAGLIIVKEYY